MSTKTITIILAVLIGISGLVIINSDSSDAANYTDGDWNFNISNGQAIIVSIDSSLTGLTSVVIPSSVTYNDTTYTVTSLALESQVVMNHQLASTGATLTIPNGITSIGAMNFNGCERFTGTLTLPSSLTTIGNAAFYGCTGFTGTLTLPVNLMSIGKNAFFNCTGITSIINLSDATLNSNSLRMSHVTEVLNLGDSPITAGSNGVPSTAVVSTTIPADRYIAPVEIVDEKTDSLTLLIIPVLVLAIVGAATLVLVGRRVD